MMLGKQYMCMKKRNVCAGSQYCSVCCQSVVSLFFVSFFSPGFDLSTEDGYNKMMADFDKVVGFQYLKGVHLNDSKGNLQ